MEQIPDDLKKAIIFFCREMIRKMNLVYLKDNGVYKNEFLEFLYLNCVRHFQLNGNFNLTEDDVAILFAVKKQNVHILNKVKSEEYFVKSIDKNDNLTLEKNEINIRTEDEGSEN